MACSGDDSIVAPKQDVEDIFWELKLDQSVAMMSVGQTLQMKATPLNVRGVPLTDLPRPTYRSSDTSALVVDSTGLLTAKGTGFFVMVIAELTSPGDYVTNVDTAFVNVTTTPAAMGTFSIQPADSNIVAAGWWKDMTVQVSDIDGGYVPDLLVHYYTNDNKIAAIDRFYGSLEPRKPGAVTVYVESNIYGVEWRDSVVINVTYPIEASIAFLNTDPILPTSPPYNAMPVIHLMKGGTVYWDNSSTHVIDITFDNPADVEGGNIDSIPPREGGMSVFPVPGTYHYRSVKWGFTGRIIVHP